jgi:hypothetical protein
MKPYEEQTALANLRKLRDLAKRIKDNGLLEILARDDQPSHGKGMDPYHKAVSIGVCDQLEIAANALQNAVNITAHLLDTTPPSGRVSTVEDCLACGRPALPHPIKGLCRECNREYKHGKWQTHGDFCVWKRAQIAKDAEQ